MMAREVARHSVEGSLLQALERKQFCLHYQPRVEMATGKVLGVEALIRWKHPVRAAVQPTISSRCSRRPG